VFHDVIVGVDGSPTGRDAIRLAQALADEGARVTLAHIYGGVPTPGRTASVKAADAAHVESERLLEAEREVGAFSAELVSFCASSVGRGLHMLAEQHAADLLVVGSHSRGLAGRVLVGDDTSASLNGASCAVAVAPRGYEARRGGFLRIGVGYDFSDESHAALAAARQLAERDSAKLSALYVVSLPAWGYIAPMPANWGEIIEDDRRAAEEKVTKLEGVDATAVYGLAGEELAAFGDRVDLLVVGSRNYGPVKRLVFGGTSHGLARHARCALLVLPRTAKPADRRRHGAHAGAGDPAPDAAPGDPPQTPS
jgi:nucleotide-binding universal stress UspA family protein